MKLERAIEIGQDCTQGALLGISQETKDALKVLIEAGKFIESSRLIQSTKNVVLLPGETEE